MKSKRQSPPQHDCTEEELLIWLRAIGQNKGMKTAVSIVADHFGWSIRGTERRFWSDEKPKGPYQLGRQLLDRELDAMDPPPDPRPWRSILQDSSGWYTLSTFGIGLMRLLEAKFEKAPAQEG